MTTAETVPSTLFDELPRMSGRPPAGAVMRSRRESRGGGSRRDFIRRVAGSGMALGLASLTVFPPARALADGYHILQECPSYAAGHACNPGCGPSVVNQAACGDNGWHMDNGCRYRLRKNECANNYWDGWMWRPTGCSQCGSARTGFRCHDGRTCPDACGGCYPTICRGFTGCS